MEEIDNAETPQPQRPTRSWYLLFLCILTFIGSGISTLSYLFMPISRRFFPAVQSTYNQMGMSEMNEQINQLSETIEHIPDWKFLLAVIPYGFAIVGAAFMLRMKPLGFHFYIISQLLLFACLNFLLGGPFAMTAIDVAFSALFVFFYYTQMREVLKTPSDDEMKSVD